VILVAELIVTGPLLNKTSTGFENSIGTAFPPPIEENNKVGFKTGVEKVILLFEIKSFLITVVLGTLYEAGKVE
jgi:hypothetical protein